MCEGRMDPRFRGDDSTLFVNAMFAVPVGSRHDIRKTPSGTRMLAWINLRAMTSKKCEAGGSDERLLLQILALDFQVGAMDILVMLIRVERPVPKSRQIAVALDLR